MEIVVKDSCNFFFFFQAEDGIRDDLVTGVQTCALPISHSKVLRCDRLCSLHWCHETLLYPCRFPAEILLPEGSADKQMSNYQSPEGTIHLMCRLFRA